MDYFLSTCLSFHGIGRVTLSAAVNNEKVTLNPSSFRNSVSVPTTGLEVCSRSEISVDQEGYTSQKLA